MVALSLENQARVKFHLGYNFATPAVDHGRLYGATNNIPDSWQHDKIVTLLNRCDASFALTQLSETTLIEILRINTTYNRTGFRPLSNTGSRSRQVTDLWMARVKAYEYDCQFLASTLGVRNYRDAEQAFNGNLIDGGIFLNSVKGDKGDKGDSGGDLRWMGVWSSGVTYQNKDSVGYNGNSYVSNVDGNIGNTPPSAQWDLWVAKGVDGSDGAKGDKGDKGDTGSKGDKGDKGDLGLLTLNVIWRGVWNELVTYDVNDMVYYEGLTYIASAESTGVIPDGSIEWLLFGGGVQPTEPEPEPLEDLAIVRVGSDGVIRDYSTYARAITNNGLQAVQDVVYTGSDYSLYTEIGTTQHGLIDYDFTSDLLNESFTLDLRLYQLTANNSTWTGACELGFLNNSPNIAIECQNSEIYIGLNNYAIFSPNAYTLDQWHHVAFVYDAVEGIYSFYFDGVRQSLGSLVPQFGKLYICVAYNNFEPWGGYIDYIRLTKGKRFTANFDPLTITL